MTVRHRLILAAVLLLTAFTYRNALHNGFVWDDTFTIVHNRAIDSLGSAASWFTNPETWSSRNEASYRPVITASFGLDVALSGRNPAWFHAVNIGIHLGVIVLAYILALRIWKHEASALAAAGIVALHPINAEAVNYVSARSSLLTTLFVLAAVAAWSRGDRRPRSAPWFIASLTFGAMALGVKETAVILPLLIIAWDRATSGPDRPLTATIRASIPWWVLVAAYLVLRTWILADQVTERPINDGAWQPFLFAIKIFLVSLWSWFVPIGSAVDHGWAWRVGAGEASALIAGGLVAAAATLAILRFDRRMGWSLIWFWVSLVPLAALPWVSRITLYQDHRVYLSGIGLAWAAGELIRRAMARYAVNRPSLIASGLLAVVVVAMAVRTDVTRTSVWRDADRLWEHALAQYPTSSLARNQVALRRLEAGDLALAREQFEASVALAPDFPLTHNYLGITYARSGELDRAITEFSTAVRLNPSYASARLNLGNAYEKAGRMDLALAAYESGVPDAPWAIGLLERAATLLERMGKTDEAQARYRRILVIDPAHAGEKSRLNKPGP